MKLIPVSQNKFTMVDDEDFEWLNQWKWCLGGGYAVRSHKRTRKILLHRLLIKIPKGMEVDHINNNPLDNQKNNLRIVTHHQNIFNTSMRKDNTSGFKGVSWQANISKWRVQIQIKKQKKHVGYFDDRLKAAKAYNKIARYLFGQFAYQNKIGGDNINV